MRHVIVIVSDKLAPRVETHLRGVFQDVGYDKVHVLELRQDLEQEPEPYPPPITSRDKIALFRADVKAPLLWTRYNEGCALIRLDSRFENLRIRFVPAVGARPPQVLISLKSRADKQLRWRTVALELSDFEHRYSEAVGVSLLSRIRQLFETLERDDRVAILTTPGRVWQFMGWDGSDPPSE